MTSVESILQHAADHGALESAEWPRTLQYILHRLDDIVADFPKPPTDANPLPPASATTDLPSRPGTSNALSSQDSHNTDKENAPPATPPRPPVPSFSAAEPQALPADTNTFYSAIRTTLSKNFPKHPPHTIQRLAELILEPKKRYRFLPPYLRALDRVVSVSSPLTVFPLPQAVLPTAGSLLNGATSSTTPQPAPLDSDESLGGALLTPIPWLQNRGQNELISESTEMVDGPNGAGRIETVTVGMLASAAQPENPPNVGQIASLHPDGETLPSTGPVTQGELLRQEQEAGIVLNNPHSLTANPTKSTFGEVEGRGTIMDTVEGEEEVPHARGPEVIGMEDTGPQKDGKLNIEGAIGRPSLDRKTPEPTASAETEAKHKNSTQAGAEKNEHAGEAGGEAKEDAAPGEKETEKRDVEMKSDD